MWPAGRAKEKGKPDVQNRKGLALGGFVFGVFLGLLHQGVKGAVCKPFGNHGIDNVDELLVALLCHDAFVDLSVLQHDV